MQGRHNGDAPAGGTRRKSADSILLPGQGGGGKADCSSRGVVARLCADLFDTVRESDATASAASGAASGKCRSIEIEASYIEIYNEFLKDLLAEEYKIR